jgi:SHS2 domain-containing protein
MTRYEILPHAADGKFRAYGRTLEEAFANAALATASLMWDWSKVEPRIEIPVEIRARDREQLLVKFLGEVVYLFDTRLFVLGRVEGLAIEEAPAVRDPLGAADTLGPLAADPAFPYRLAARFLGDGLGDRAAIYGSVKAVTYSEMKIERCACAADGEGGGVVIQVVVDM